MQGATFEYLRRLVHERSAVVLEPDQAYLAETRLMPLAEEYGCRSVEELVTRLQEERAGRLHRRVVEAMVTNETMFFRDAGCFAALRDDVLPELLARRAEERALRIWSAACSTGQEPYSVAMLLRESFGALDGWELSVLATDLSSEALRRARDGVYTQLEVSRGLPPALLERWFVREPPGWRLRPAIGGMVEFRHLNLTGPWSGLPRMDVVLFRNVLIYFDVETKRSMLRRIRRVLRPDGYLVLGASETTLMLDDAFERVAVPHPACYRVRPGRAG
jgi:chemotaxis protein methyltransferase CheR